MPSSRTKKSTVISGTWVRSSTAETWAMSRHRAGGSGWAMVMAGSPPGCAAGLGAGPLGPVRRQAPERLDHAGDVLAHRRLGRGRVPGHDRRDDPLVLGQRD